MSVAEIKKTIIDKVETLSGEQLAELNKFIDTINNSNNSKPKEYELLQYVENLVSEREEVLKKLAQ